MHDDALAPYLIAPDTWVIGQLYQPPGAPVGVHLNSMIITGREPVLVDTGAALFEQEWLKAAWSVVDPGDVRWVFLSHEEPDHAGNILAVLDACPRAQLITSWFAMERLAAHHALPLPRCRWLNDGDSFDAGGRELFLVRPPVYDAPTTRGLFDPITGAYWAADAFATPVLRPTADAEELPDDFWEEGFLQFQRLVAPWHAVADTGRFGATVERVAALQPTVVATCHGPAVSGRRLDEAMGFLRQLPELPAAALPTQGDLEQILATVGKTADTA